ncbi:hypothetical protein V2J09_000695 [Rumex salicifolius]
MGHKSSNNRTPTKAVEPIEEDYEDYCFVCKDGGELILCDHESALSLHFSKTILTESYDCYCFILFLCVTSRTCTKAYHLQCAEKPDSGEQFICGCHTCCKCHKSSSIRCICCPNAVCERCIVNNEEFARVGKVYGICDECLKLAMMVEEGINVDSEGEEADFNDRESMEGLFKEYWEIVRDKENLTIKDLQAARAQMGNSKTHKSSPKRSHSDEYALDGTSDADCENEVTQKKNKSYRKKSRGKRKKKDDSKSDIEASPKNNSESKKVRQKQQKKEAKGSKKIEFIGWGSKPLIEFLISIGKDTSHKLSQSDVADIMVAYARENKLFDSVNKKKIITDPALYSVLRRKSLTIYKVKDFLECHFLENMEDSDSDDGCSSEDGELKCLLSSSKKVQKNSTSKTCQQKDTTLEKVLEDIVKPVVLYSCYASVVPANIKLVYLKKSLIEELLKKPESFDNKVIGSFVKVKSDVRKFYYELLQVTDVKRPDNGNKKDTILKLSGIDSDVLISMLSDDDFSEEECEELRHKVENGILESPTVVDLQQKAETLHEDITKHAIARELIVLQHRIDLANEKGRRDLYPFAHNATCIID